MHARNVNNTTLKVLHCNAMYRIITEYTELLQYTVNSFMTEIIIKSEHRMHVGAETKLSVKFILIISHFRQLLLPRK